MNNRLKQFLSAENISQSQFADTIKVVRASVSHVLSGRNNPSYDFIKAIMAGYPKLNIEWLIFGKGKMYKEQQEISTPPAQPAELTSNSLFEDEPETLPEPEAVEVASEEISQAVIPLAAQRQRKVRKVIILYDDDSYQEL